MLIICKVTHRANTRLLDELDRCAQYLVGAPAGQTRTGHAERQLTHWARVPWDEDRGWVISRVYSDFLTCAAEHGLTLYISSKLEAMGRKTGSVADNSRLLICAMGARTAEECQLNPDLVEMLLNHGADPLTRLPEDTRSFSAWSALIVHEAGRGNPELRHERWKKIAAMFVKHLNSLEQISRVEELLAELNPSSIKQQLKERAEHLATFETPLHSGAGTPQEQPLRRSKRQKRIKHT